MTEWVLAATEFIQAVERHDNGSPRRIVKHRRGDIVAGLSEKDVERLRLAGAIVPLDAAAPVADPDGGGSAAAGEHGDVDADLEQRPAQAATKDLWIEYAVSKGAERAEAEQASKAELIKAYG